MGLLTARLAQRAAMKVQSKTTSHCGPASSPKTFSVRSKAASFGINHRRGGGLGEGWCGGFRGGPKVVFPSISSARLVAWGVQPWKT